MHGIVKEKYDGDLSKLILAAFEKGYNALDGIYAHDITEWEDFQEFVDELVENKNDVPFEIVALDTVDVMGKMATDYILKVQGRKDKKKYTAINDLAYGKGYEMLEREMGEQIAKLDNAGYALMFLTHDKDRQFETREGLKYDKTTLSLGGRVRDLILNMADFIVFIELSKELVKGVAEDRRYIYFRGDSGLEAGSRFKHVPNRIEYSFDGFIDTIEDAILKEYGGDEKEVEKAKKKQNKEKEEQAQEYIENTKAQSDISSLQEEALSIAKGLSKENKKLAGKLFMDKLGDVDPKKCEDAKALLEVINVIKGW